ncbi:hypothetical protein Dimus_006439, partial [Dionaea muscipula]
MSAKGGKAVVCCPPSRGDEAGSGRRLLLLLSASIDERRGVMGGLFLDDAKRVVMVLGGEVGRWYEWSRWCGVSNEAGVVSLL